MFTKTLIPAAVVISALALSNAVYAGPVYQGGPKSPVANAPTQTFQTNKPYAQYAPGTQVGVKDHIYIGGPKSPIPHARRR